MTFAPVGQGKLKEVTGSVLSTQNSGLRFIINATNKKCNLEYDLIKDFDKKWKNVRGDLKTWFNNPANHKLGNIRELAVQSDTWIVHMLCQDENLKTDEKALKECLKKVAELARYEQASVHLSHKTVEQVPELKNLVEEFILNKNISVYVYKD